VAFHVHGEFIFGFAKRALELREEMGDRLGVVPDVGAGAVAAAGADENAFPAPKVSVFLAQDGGDLRMARLELMASRASGGMVVEKSASLNAVVRDLSDA